MAHTKATSPPTIHSHTAFTRASIGKKVLMAVSGIVAFGYILGHMLGNLQIFLGQDQLNAYAETLHSLGGGLWLIRIVLLFFFVLHIWLGIKLKAENMQAKPAPYQVRATVRASLSSRTMIWTGLTVLAFFIYHVLHFTARTTDPRFLQLPLDTAGRYDVYSMVVLGFQSYVISVFYVIAVGLLCFHLSHGIYSMFQSLGLTSSDCNKPLHRFAQVVALIVFLGFSAVPVAVLSGAVKLPPAGASTTSAQVSQLPAPVSLDSGESQ